jgi:hypothetical protein
MNILENFDLAEATARSAKLRGRYNRSGLSNTDYNELLQLEKAIEIAAGDRIVEIKMVKSREEFISWHYSEFCKAYDFRDGTNQAIYNSIYSTEDNLAEREIEFKVWSFKQSQIDDLKNSLNELAQKYRAEAHELSRIGDFEKSQMYSHFANELDRLNKGGA